MEGCFMPLLRWILEKWQGTEQSLAFTLDATTPGERFTVLAISVIYRGCEIQVAWHVLQAREKEVWHPHWVQLLGLVGQATGPEWFVAVMADRGMYGKWLFDEE